ncbi:MAG TPA: hypothetical protein VK704_05705 [Acidimicrobiales bacterium]|nr:hypothetical protein [Acidimicrobiales bacterium]
MLGDKEEHFVGKGTDLSALASHIEEYLKTNGYTVQSAPPSEAGSVIQAHKGGFWRTAVAADRALTITIQGNSADYTVKFGIGKWLEHLGVAAVETLLLSEIFLVVDVADSLWSLEVEDKLITNVKSFIG